MDQLHPAGLISVRATLPDLLDRSSLQLAASRQRAELSVKLASSKIMMKTRNTLIFIKYFIESIHFSADILVRK